MIPVCPSTRRTRWLVCSAMYTLPRPSTATPLGPASIALVAGPPSPARPRLPVPAMDVRIPVMPSTRKTRLEVNSTTYRFSKRSTAIFCGRSMFTVVASVPLPTTAAAVHVVTLHASHPSAGLVLPSSHCSPQSTTPSPHISILVQSALQPPSKHSPIIWPSSQTSRLPTAPFPHSDPTQTPPMHVPTLPLSTQDAPSTRPLHAST